MKYPGGNPATAPASFFIKDGNDFLPTILGMGPWGPSLAGNYPGGLLARAVEGEVNDVDLQPARLTVDLMRPVLIEPVQIHSSVVRDSRRLRLVDAVMTQNGDIVCRASALFLRRSEHPVNTVWTAPIPMPALPAETTESVRDRPFFMHSFGRDPIAGSPGLGLTEWRHDGQKFVWVRETHPLVEGETLSPFTRAAMAADITSALCHWGPEGMQFINADYTLTLSRLPAGEYIGLASVTHYGHGGVATGVASLFDEKGPIGSGVATALANSGFAPKRRIESS